MRSSVLALRSRVLALRSRVLGQNTEYLDTPGYYPPLLFLKKPTQQSDAFNICFFCFSCRFPFVILFWIILESSRLIHSGFFEIVFLCCPSWPQSCRAYCATLLRAAITGLCHQAKLQYSICRVDVWDHWGQCNRCVWGATNSFVPVATALSFRDGTGMPLGLLRWRWPGWCPTF